MSEKSIFDQILDNTLGALRKKRESKSASTGLAKIDTEKITKDANELSKELIDKSSQALDKSKELLENKVAPEINKAKEKIEAKIEEKKKEQELKKEKAKNEAAKRAEYAQSELEYQKGVVGLRDLLAPSDMKVNFGDMRISGVSAKSLLVTSYPRYLSSNWMSPIINFDSTMNISHFVYPFDSERVLNILKKKVTQMQATMRINREKGLVRDPALETALQDAEELRTRIQRGQEKFFHFGFYMTVLDPDEKKAERNLKQLEATLGGQLMTSRRTNLRAEQAYHSTMPICEDELDSSVNMNTSPLSSSFPFTSATLTSEDGILYGLNRHNDSLVIYDRFSLENANSVVFAKSGAGKSYAVKLEILRSLMLGADVIVIDPENEYEDLSTTVGGTYLNVSLNSDKRINPFDLPQKLKDVDLKPGDLLRSNIITIHGLLKLMFGDITPTEESLLDKALIDVYAIKGITMDLVDPSGLEPPTLPDLQNVLEGMKGTEDLVKKIEKYTKGTFSGIFNMPTNIDIKNGLMVFSVRDLEDQLRPIAMYIILNYIWNRVRSSLKKRLLVVDEAWTLMQHEDSAKFLFGLVKRARKYYLGITTITQDVEDFLKSKYGKPIITNSSMQLLLKQAPTAAEVLKTTFNLTEGERYLLLNSGVGQGLFFAGNQHVAIQIIASYTENEIVTTNPEEMIKKEV